MISATEANVAAALRGMGTLKTSPLPSMATARRPASSTTSAMSSSRKLIFVPPPSRQQLSPTSLLCLFLVERELGLGLGMVSVVVCKARKHLR